MSNSPFVVNIKYNGCDVYVGRPSKWGNPFKIGPDGDRAEVLRKYMEFLLANPQVATAAKQELKGKVLGCHCAPRPCHADILAEIANAE